MGNCRPETCSSPERTPEVFWIMRNSASIIALFFVFVAGAPNVRADTIVPVATYELAAYGALEQYGSFTGNGATLSASETFVNPFGGVQIGQISERASVSSTSAAVNALAIGDSSGVNAEANASIAYFISIKQFKPTAVNSVILDVNGSVSVASSALSGGYNFADASLELFDNTAGTTVAHIEASTNCLLGGCTAPSGEAEEEATPLVGVGDFLEFTLQARCIVSGYPGFDGTCSAIADPAVTIDPRSPDAADFGLEFSPNLPQEAPAAQVPEPCTLALVLFGFGLALAMQKQTR
jgi:hypothetical protein